MRSKRGRRAPHPEENPFPPFISILYKRSEAYATVKTSEKFNRRTLRASGDDLNFVETKDEKGWWPGKIVAEGSKTTIIILLNKFFLLYVLTDTHSECEAALQEFLDENDPMDVEEESDEGGDGQDVASPDVDPNSSDDMEWNEGAGQRGAPGSLEQRVDEGGMRKDGVEDRPFSKGKLFWYLNLSIMPFWSNFWFSLFYIVSLSHFTCVT